MNFFAKKIGNLFNFVIGGRPKAITAKTEEEQQELTELAKAAAEGSEEALNSIKEKIAPETPNSAEQELKQAELKTTKAKQTVVELQRRADLKTNRWNLLKNNPLFTVGDNNDVRLTGYKAEMPLILADKFVELLEANQPIDHMVDFWKLTLLLKNAEARKGLYNFITKQRLMVLPSGFFVGFRRVIQVKAAGELRTQTKITQEELQEFLAKAKKAHQSVSYYNIREENGVKFLQPISTKTQKGDFVDTLYNQVAAFKTTQDVGENEAVYTDAHTRTMRIKIGQPVRIPRSQCNEDGRESCSRGLHIGSEKYVSSNKNFGSVIVVCILNPQHVISVPYSDAHKMRMCEYFPAFIISEQEFHKFDFSKVDWTQYTKAYRKIEDARLEKALDVIDSLTPDERKAFAPQEVNPNQVNSAMQTAKALEEKSTALRKKLAVCLEDDISNALDFNELQEILKSRVVKKIK